MLHPSSALLTLAASICGEWHTARWFHDTHLGHTPVHSALATHCASVTPSSPPYSPRSFQEHQPTSHWERCTNLWASELRECAYIPRPPNNTLLSAVPCATPKPAPSQHINARLGPNGDSGATVQLALLCEGIPCLTAHTCVGLDWLQLGTLGTRHTFYTHLQHGPSMAGGAMHECAVTR